MESKTASFAELLNSWSTFGTFAIAVGSLIIAIIALLRTAKHERPYGSLSLTSIDNTHFLAAMTFNNPSRLSVRIERLVIDLPHFRWGHLSDVQIDDGLGNMIFPPKINIKEPFLAGPPPGGAFVLTPGEHSERDFLIFQPEHSRKKTVTVRAFYRTLEGRSKWRPIVASARTRSDF